MKNGVYRWSCSDIEVEESGFFLAKSEKDAAERIKKIALTDECLEVKFVMTRDDLERLLVSGYAQTEYSDWDD